MRTLSSTARRPGATAWPIHLVGATCLAFVVWTATLAPPAARSTPRAAPAAAADLPAELAPLEGLRLEAGRFHWRGLEAGIGHREAAAVLGSPVATPRSDPAGWCGEVEAAVRIDGDRAVLAFAGAGAGDPLRSVTVPSPGGAATPLATLATAIEHRWPGLERLPAAGKLLYRSAAGQLLFVDPGSAAAFGLPCID